jgi:hypothetical protein
MSEREPDDEALPNDDVLAAMEAHALWKKLLKTSPAAITRDGLIDAFHSMASKLGSETQRDSIAASVDALLPLDVVVGDNARTEAAFTALYRRWCFRTH